METLLEIIKITLPALIVFFTAYRVLKTYLENDQKKALLEISNNQKKQSLNTRLQAFERMALFLERITPNSLLHRTKKSGMKSRQLHLALLNNIRTEYDHNVAQQIYISIETWELIKAAKEATTNLINLAAQKCDPESDANELHKLIIQELSQIKEHELPTQRALYTLKNEVVKLY